MTDSLRGALRTLRLPIPPEQEQAAVAAVQAELTSRSVDEADHARVVSLEQGDWQRSRLPSPLLEAVVKVAIEAADPPGASAIAPTFFALHRRLMENHALSHDQASALMSRASLIWQLAASPWLMSCARIDDALGRLDQRFFGWRAVQTVLRALGDVPSISREQIAALIERDREREPDFFGDATRTDAIERTEQVAADLGLPEDIAELLQVLTEAPVVWPYLQILHYQCATAAFYDHALTTLYEFAPRGEAARLIFESYPPQLLSATGNPVLNNAKAVDRLDERWAVSRPDHPREADALVRLLIALESLDFAARMELAAVLRLFLLRIVRLLQTPLITLPPADLTSTEALVTSLLAHPMTATAGVLEQRVVDAVAAVRHPASDGWHERGLRDSVNASNLSRKKLGDCEFQNAASHRVVAYESHGGRLSEVYVEDHKRVLERVIPLRSVEWEAIAPLDEWEVEVVFVASEVAYVPPDPFEVEGVRVTIVTTTLGDFVSSVPMNEDFIESLDENVVQSLNEPRTPDATRETYRRMVEPSTS